jgi:spore maturation protein CgeB
MDNVPKILYVTRLNNGATGFGFLDGFRGLDLIVKEVDTSEWLGNWTSNLYEKIANKFRRRRLPQYKILAMNQAVIAAADEFKPDLSFFVGAPYILPETLEQTRKYGQNFCYYLDDMLNPACQSMTFYRNLNFWDCILTTKSYNVAEFQALGASRVVFCDNAYIPRRHRPVAPSAEEYEKFKGDVVFIGNFNHPSRADFLAELIYRCPEVKFNIWGLGWDFWKKPYYWIKPRRWRTWPLLLKVRHNYPLFFDEMSKAMNSHKIVLGLLNHQNRDLQTSRTMEIPACGAFMLMERSAEQLELFKEDLEACYFSSVDELVTKIKYYLTHDTERQLIAQAGHNRLLASKYSFDDQARTVLNYWKQHKDGLLI